MNETGSQGLKNVLGRAPYADHEQLHSKIMNTSKGDTLGTEEMENFLVNEAQLKRKRDDGIYHNPEGKRPCLKTIQNYLWQHS